MAKRTKISGFFGLMVRACLCFVLICAGACQKQEEKTLNIYAWSDAFPPGLLEAFTQETGIRVHYDTFDSNDTLESKLLLGIAGYDIVFPSLWPYFARQAKAGLFLKLDLEKLPFIKDLDPFIVNKFKQADPQLSFGLPYMWGVFAMAYDQNKLKHIPNLPLTSERLLFDPAVVKTVSQHCGISYMEEALDILPPIMRYLKTTDIQRAGQHLATLRPHIRRFNWSRSLQDLANGEVCLAQTLLSSAYKLRLELQKTGSAVDLAIVIPDEGSALWIDTIAIPKTAGHVANAYKFINFLMRPENLAKISNYLYELNSHLESVRYLTTHLKELYTKTKAASHKLHQNAAADKETLRAYAQAMEQAVYGAKKGL